MKDTTKDMAKHAAMIGVVGLGAMKVYGQDTNTAVKHSSILALGAFLYMGTFGHGLPTKLRGPFNK
jgi:hypothetical protein